jgi:choline dehydrogenase-like flavoprotein
LLEAGGEDRNRWIHIPLGFGKTFADPSVNWCYETEPDPGAGDRRVFWPRGKVLGGSSSINGMVYIRGQAEDFDHWRQLGNGRVVVRGRSALFQTLGAPDARRRQVPRHRRTALRVGCRATSDL